MASSSYLKIYHSNPIPLSLTSSLTPHHRPSSTSTAKPLFFSIRPCPKLSSKLVFNVSRKTLIRTHPSRQLCIPPDSNPIFEVFSTEIKDEKQINLVDEGHRESLQQQQEEKEKEKVRQFKKRVVFGVGIGVAGIDLAGGWIFTVALAAVVYIGAALNSGIGAVWPILLGGRAHWTVGLVATLISFSRTIAADTYAYLGGKTFGRTPLTTVSPKKTWEGAIAGLSGCIATALMLSKVFCWTTSLLNAAAFGFLNFVGSLFGDLIESMIKREAGVKDSGSLIPGHGGILDRVDSYIFTGALAFSFVRIFLPLYGV